MCICVNCQFVDRCVTYHQVETSHQTLHRNQSPDFQPRQSQIKVHRRPERMEFDVVHCGSFQAQEKFSNV